MESNFNSRSAPPLKCPIGLASTTSPVTRAPEAMTSSPFTVTARASVPPNVWPGWLIFEPTSSASWMVSTLPAGIVIVTGRGGAEFCGGAEFSGAGALLLACELSGVWELLLWLGLLQPTASSRVRLNIHVPTCTLITQIGRAHV